MQNLGVDNWMHREELKREREEPQLCDWCEENHTEIFDTTAGYYLCSSCRELRCEQCGHMADECVCVPCSMCGEPYAVLSDSGRCESCEDHYQAAQGMERQELERRLVTAIAYLEVHESEDVSTQVYEILEGRKP